MMRCVTVLAISALSLAGSDFAAHAFDHRVDPGAASRAEISFAPSRNILRALDAGTDNASLPREYASAMTWYRVALADGYAQAPLVASPWVRDEQLPEPLHWAWIADNSDLLNRVGKGLYRISFASNQSPWFQEVDCRLQAWPEGNSEVPMACNDGKPRTMQIPGDGIVLVDDVQYVRVFDSEETTLPPPEVLPDEKLTAAERAAMATTEVSILQPDGASPQAEESSLPEEAPVPQLR
jgi:hypothetical protein